MSGNEDSVYESWLNDHLRKRQGAGRKKLEEGLHHESRLFLRNVWYPAFHSFDGLHPEFEVLDFRDGIRLIDFAYIRFPLKLAIEIDGYGTHCEQLTRRQFADHLTRQNHLAVDGWRVLRFSYDDVRDRPRSCIQLIQQFMGAFGEFNRGGEGRAAVTESEIMRLAAGLGRPLRPKDVSDHLRIHLSTAYRMVKSMRRKGMLIPAGSGAIKVRSYIVNRAKLDFRQ